MSRQTSRKTGMKSSAQKEADARHDYRTVPPAQPVPGAHGQEPSDNAEHRSTPKGGKEDALRQGREQLYEETADDQS